MKNLFLAIKFLTGINIGILPDRARIKPRDLAASMSLFPLAGALIGCALAAAYYVASLLAPDKPLILGAAVLVAYLLLTRGFHLDGLMKAAGPIFVFSSLIIRFALAGALTRSNAFPALILAAACGRAFGVLGAKFYPPAKQDISMKQLSEFLGLREAIWSVVTIALLCIILAGLKGWMALILSFLLLLITATYMARRIGGMTSDALGAITEIAELIYLFLFILMP